MKTLIVIPSYNRPYEIKKKIGYWIEEIKNADVRVFICPDQAMYYEQALDPKYIVLGEKQGGVGGYVAQLAFAKKWAEENGYEYIIKCDDDMVFKCNGVKKPDQGKRIDESILLFEERFEADINLAAIAYCGPMEYLHGDKQSFKPRNKHFSGNYVIRLNRWFILKDVHILEDMYVWLEIKDKRLGYCETYLGLYQDAALGSNEGGLQSFDRMKMSLDAYNTLKDKYYPHLFLKDKEKFKDKVKYDMGKLVDTAYYKKL